MRILREAPKTARIYLARARYAEEQAARCVVEEDRALWQGSARDYRALAQFGSRNRTGKKKSQPVRRPSRRV